MTSKTRSKMKPNSKADLRQSTAEIALSRLEKMLEPLIRSATEALCGNDELPSSSRNTSPNSEHSSITKATQSDSDNSIERKSSKGDRQVCLFCSTNDDNELALGKLLSKQGITVHNFCMLFSSGLPQRGKTDSAGILGFLTADIVKEANRGKRLSCVYCKKKGATIGCTVRHCRRQFHLPCGVNANSLHQFFDQFCSFCEDHRPQQGMEVVSNRLSFHGTANSMCSICLCPVETRTSNHTLRAPCCKNSWFHRTCLQRQALSAGYFFKCPLCNNKDTFQSEMLKFGIYIPEQDAAWELEENAFGELLYRHNKCDAAACRCPQGRAFNKEGSRWTICLCNTCGSQGCHVACGKLNFQNPHWECTNCIEILNAPSAESQPLEEQPENPSHEEQQESQPPKDPIKRRGKKRRQKLAKKTSPPKQPCIVRETRSNSELFKSSAHSEASNESHAIGELLRAAPSSSSLSTASFVYVGKTLTSSTPNDTDTEVDIETVDESITPLSLFTLPISVSSDECDSIIDVCSGSDEEAGQLLDGCSYRPEDDNEDSLSLLLTPSTMAPPTPHRTRNSAASSAGCADSDGDSDCIIIDVEDDDFFSLDKTVDLCDDAINKTMSNESSGAHGKKPHPSGIAFGNLVLAAVLKSDCGNGRNASGIGHQVTPTHMFRNVSYSELITMDGDDKSVDAIQGNKKEVNNGGMDDGAEEKPTSAASRRTFPSSSNVENIDNAVVSASKSSAVTEKDVTHKQKFHQTTLSPFFRRSQKIDDSELPGQDHVVETALCVKREAPSASAAKPNSLRPAKGKCKIEFFVQRGRVLSSVVPFEGNKKKSKVLPSENMENRTDIVSSSALNVAAGGCHGDRSGSSVGRPLLKVEGLHKHENARKSMKDKTASQACNNIAVLQSKLS